ncbi:MAG: Gfo/Idh/MocA family oxidoreductase [Kineosporiaceae bacterium]
MTTMSGSPVRFGFLGAGGIAHSALAPAVHAADGAVLHAGAARDPQRVHSLEPAGPAYGDYNALLADDDVEVVYISLSNDLHAPWTLAALEAGKHVLCEKPLGLDAAQTRAMVDAAAAAGRMLVEAFWYRWHPRTRRLESLLAAGDLGELVGVDTEFSFRSDWTGTAATNYRLDPTKGGGGLYDVGCYAVSLVHTALDAAGRGGPLDVVAAEAVLGPTGVDVDATATLRPSGAGEQAPAARLRCGISVHDLQAIAVTGTQGRAVFGAAGVAEREDPAFTSWHMPAFLTVHPAGGGEAVVERFEPVDPYRLMVEQLARAVRGQDAWLVPGSHSVAVAQTLDDVRAEAVGSDG